MNVPRQPVDPNTAPRQCVQAASWLPDACASEFSVLMTLRMWRIKHSWSLCLLILSAGSGFANAVVFVSCVLHASSTEIRLNSTTLYPQPRCNPGIELEDLCRTRAAETVRHTESYTYTMEPLRNSFRNFKSRARLPFHS